MFDPQFDQQSPARKSYCHVPPNFMFRPVQTRLLDALKLDASKWPKVLSIIAPIGYGKTVLMSELFAHLTETDGQCCWVALDDCDADVERVLAAIELAFYGRGVAVQPNQTLFPSREPIESRVDWLLGAISHLSAPATIFIDNLNSCTDAALGDFLDALIFRTPPSVHFVWSSSVELPFSQARAKLQGLIRQIGYAELCLDSGETCELLGPALSDQIGNLGVATLLRQTEGWPAAIRMAQIILADANNPLQALKAFTGSDEDIAALLNRQVLNGFDPRLREFVLCLAQLRTFSVDLARHASNSDEAEQYIDILLRRNIFIIPLDRNRKWYRLHGLFRTHLLNEAERSLSPKQRNEVLHRAANWCEQAGEWRDAIEYALAAGTGVIASRILERTATSFVRDRGDIQQYIRWIDALQREGVRIGWEASFWYVWALIFSRRYEYGRQQHERLSNRMRHRSGTVDAAPGDLPQRMKHLRICISLFTDDLVDVQQRADHWLLVEETEDPFNVGSISCMKSICLASSYKFAEARRTMRVAQPILLQVESTYSIGWASLINATLSSYQGDYLSAYEEISQGLQRTREILGDEAGICGTMALVGAQCAVEMGLDVEARDLLRLGLRTVHSHGLVDTAASGFEAAIKLWGGNANEFVSIAQLREIANSYPPRLSLMLSCYLVQRLLRLGRLADAQAEAGRLGLTGGDSSGTLETDALTIPRYLDVFTTTAIDLSIANGEFKKAKSLITEAFAKANAEGRVARQVEFCLFKAAIVKRIDNPDNALKEVAIAIRRAASRRIVRPFIDHAELIADLINNSKPSSWSFPIGEERDFFDEICRTQPIARRLNQNRFSGRSFDPGIVDMPTKREIEILTLMGLGLSNQQLADHESVSITTIKWHLQNMYRKLGVTNRAAALARARVLSILPK